MGKAHDIKAYKTGPPPIKDGIDYINIQEEDQMEIFGYKPHKLFTILTWLGIIGTCGLLRLVFHWQPAWMLYFTHVRCPLRCAKKVLLVDQYHQIFVEAIKQIVPSDINISAMLSLVHDVTNTDSNSLTTINGEKIPPVHLVQPGSEGQFEITDSLLYFDNKKVRYIWDSTLKIFVKLRGLDRNVPCSFFHHQTGLSSTEQVYRRILYGDNNIVVHVQSIIHILFQEVLEPFYIFQVFSMIIWYLDDYVYYASCIIIMSVLSLTTGVMQIRKNQRTLRDTVHATDVVNVWRGKEEYETIPSEHLVPGDVIVIPKRGCIMQCDAVLISGNCIVNESMLTGESVPVTKTPLPNPGIGKVYQDKSFHPKEHARHTLFCGTKVIQTRYYGSEKVKAVVIRTGFLTAKGELVRSIMFPKPVDFKFNRHVHKFICCLAGFAIIGFVYTVVLKTQRGVPAGDIALRALDLITIIIPPALPAAMTIGIVFAQQRLKKRQIYCISPRCINISGCINCVCFDKTGTLTEEGLDLWGVVPADSNKFSEPVKNISMLRNSSFLIGMTTCHSLTIIDNQLSGDPLDLKMFEATEWILEEPEIDDTTKFDVIIPTIVRPKHNDVNCDKIIEREPPFEVGIVRQYPFSSSLQRMSVITRVLGAQQFEIYCKGAPETITSLCNVNTVPCDFSETLMQYTQQGYRVLALAYRPLGKLTYAKAQRISREELECNLTFLGLLIMENRLKPETIPVLSTLKAADIRLIMVTGDNMLTALSVARDCGMIDYQHQVIVLSATEDEDTGLPSLSWHYADMQNKKLDEDKTIHKDSVNVIVEKSEKLHIAITGKTFSALRKHHSHLLKKVAVNGTVFSRMAPEQKQQLIELLQELGYYVGMCGDGANDCGALKAAHAGISLSEAEASVASPFTSKTPNISCVPTLIREGRAALVTSFGVLKYMALYSLIQFISVLILYTLYSNLTDMEFLYIDLFLITLFAALFGRTQPYDSLVKRPPPSSLIGITPLSSLLSQIVLVIIAQVLGVLVLWQQPWYKPHVSKDEDDHKCHDNYAVFAVSVFQYITLAIVYSKGAPYRKSFFTNLFFLISLIVMTAFTLYLVLKPHQWLADSFEMEMEGTTWAFRLQLVGIALVHFVISYLTEAFLVGYIIFHKCKDRLSKGKRNATEFQLIEEETRGAPTWLPLNESPTESSFLTLPHSNTVTSAFSGSSLEYSGGDKRTPENENRDEYIININEKFSNSYRDPQDSCLNVTSIEHDVLSRDIANESTSL
ncbi:polyamine-transporting ATPase 13A3 isoform X1 [Centruroides vittatus]|uniref:polyamine-transporting ATPase 13A3 isoform X1 n=2 Tax=Centruroides vittatus TaxID=120091 RepID=UPI00350E98F1